MKPYFTIAKVLITLYAVALLSSMSGMEILSWALVALFLIAVIKKRVSIKAIQIHPVVGWTLFSFFIIGCIGLFIRGNTDEQIKGIGSMRWIILLYVFSFWLEEPTLMKRAVLALIGFGTFVAIFSIYQHFTGVDLNFLLGLHKASLVGSAPYQGSNVFQCMGFFGHHLKYGYSMLFVFTMTLALAVQNIRNRAFPIASLYVVCSAIMALTLVWTYGRGVWMATLVGAIVVVACFGKRVLLPALLAIAILVGSVVAVSPGIRERGASVTKTDYTSNSDRRDLWRANWAMFLDHPIFGVGILRNEDLTAEYYEKLGIKNQFVGHAHNTYINFLSMMGLPGVLAYLVFIGSFIMLSISVLRSKCLNTFEFAVVAGILGGELAFHVGGITQCNFKDAVNNHLFIFLLGAIAALYRRSLSSLSIAERNPKTKFQSRSISGQAESFRC